MSNELGHAYYAYTRCLQIVSTINKKAKAGEDIAKEVLLYQSNIATAFLRLGVANGLYYSLDVNRKSTIKGVKLQRSSQASKAAKAKNAKQRKWVLEDYDRVRALPTDFEGCGMNGRFIKEKFARKYSDLVKKKYKIKDEDKLVPATILRWIKGQ